MHCAPQLPKVRIAVAAALALAAGAVGTAPASAEPLTTAAATLWLPLPVPEAEAVRLSVAAPTDAERRLWLEITPLASDAPPVFYLLQATAGSALPVLGVERGAVLACIGEAARAVTCRERFLAPGVATALRLEPGRVVTGRYRLGDAPLAGARVAVVPDGLTAPRPLLMPLALGDRLEREVETDEDGRFVLPALASGRYRLETMLPTGRTHHGEPFDVIVAGGDDPLDLGTAVVLPGLTMEVLARDDQDRPVPDAMVAARQGTTPEDAALYQRRADAGGRAELSGFTVEQPIEVSCTAPGHASAETRFELVPVSTTCVLARQARLVGRILAGGADPPAGTHVRLVPLAPPDPGDGGAGADRDDDRGGPAADAAYTSGVSITGALDLRGIDPGAYVLQIAAPGFATLAHDLALLPGERHDLGVLSLGAAASLAGVVVDARDGTPIEGAVVRVLEPAAGDLAISDREGTFGVTEPDADLPLVLEARHPDFAVARVTVPPRSDRVEADRLPAARGPADVRRRIRDDGPVRIALERGGRILAVIWDATSGRFCRGCRVRVSPGDLELVTDGDGEALSELLVPGRYRVELARITHLGSTVIEQPEAEVRWARVVEDGVVAVWFGERADVVRVRFRPDPGTGWVLVGRSPGRSQRLLADPDGAFPLAQRPDEAIGLYLLGWDADAEVEVEVRQGQLLARPARRRPAGLATPAPREVVLELPRSELRGRVTSLGRGVAGLRVRLRGLHDGQRAALLATDPDGRFRVPYLPPGVYAVEAGQRTLKLVRISPRERLDIGTFDLVPGSF